MAVSSSGHAPAASASGVPIMSSKASTVDPGTGNIRSWSCVASSAIARSSASSSGVSVISLILPFRARLGNEADHDGGKRPAAPRSWCMAHHTQCSAKAGKWRAADRRPPRAQDWSYSMTANGPRWLRRFATSKSMPGGGHKARLSQPACAPSGCPIPSSNPALRRSSLLHSVTPNRPDNAPSRPQDETCSTGVDPRRRTNRFGSGKMRPRDGHGNGLVNIGM
jgi:hypothetical protein